MKKCVKCGESKTLDEFARKKAAKDGRRARCKACHNQDCKEYRATNPVYALEESKEKRNARHRKWRSENKEQVAQGWQAWYAKNREAKNLASQQWYRDNKQRAAETHREWSRRNPHSAAEREEKRRSLKLACFVEDVDFTVLRARDAACYLCGCVFQEGEALHADHKIPLSRMELGPEHSYQNLAMTHAFCNHSKKDRTPEEYWAARNTSWPLELGEHWRNPESAE